MSSPGKSTRHSDVMSADDSDMRSATPWGDGVARRGDPAIATIHRLTVFERQPPRWLFERQCDLGQGGRPVLLRRQNMVPTIIADRLGDPGPRARRSMVTNAALRSRLLSNNEMAMISFDFSSVTSAILLTAAVTRSAAQSRQGQDRAFRNRSASPRRRRPPASPRSCQTPREPPRWFVCRGIRVR